MAELSPMWTKKRIPDDELDAYLNGNPTDTTGPQHFLYQPNYNDCLAANDVTSGKHTRNGKLRNRTGTTSNKENSECSINQRFPIGPDIPFREYKLVESRTDSRSMNVNSRIPISERLPMGPDIRFREYTSYIPYKPSACCPVDTFHRDACSKYKNSNNKLNNTKPKHQVSFIPSPKTEKQPLEKKENSKCSISQRFPIGPDIPFREYKLVESRTDSRSMNVNSRIPISERLPMGPDIRFREYASYIPYKPSACCPVDTFHKDACSKYKNSTTKVNNTKPKQAQTLTHQVSFMPSPKTEKQPLEKTDVLEKKEIPEKTDEREKSYISENKEIAYPIIPEKTEAHETSYIPEKKEKTVQIKTDLNEVMVYPSFPKAVSTTMAALAWKRMYEQHSGGAREGFRPSTRWDAAIDF